MSGRIAILTPDPEDEGFQSRWRDVFDDAAAPLRDSGLDVEDRSWADLGDLRSFDLVIPLLVWGYHRAGPKWHDAVDRWEAEGVRLANPPPVLHWNADKLYLGELARRGASVVPTLYTERCTEGGLLAAAEQFGSDRLVVKPQVSASAWQTIRWSPGLPLLGGPTGPAMIQPYLSAIENDGEISLIYFNGEFSHAIKKVPQPGDFRVQPEYRGVITAHLPAPDERGAADQIMTAAGEDLLYARVDLVRDLQGKPALMELELVEPDLYLQYDPEAPRCFANAVRRTAALVGR